jgi:hypothetical protein
MLNDATPASGAMLSVIDYHDPIVADRMANGRMNVGEDGILANIRSSIRRGHTQMRGGPVRPERICLVGSGPSLNDTLDELRALVWDGAILVTLNGAYHWCIERGLQPRTQIVMDARPSNARFVNPPVPGCRYVLASQCDPDVWDAVEGRDDVWIFHSVVKQEGVLSEALDRYYGGQWVGIGGGTTVATRAINLLRTAGYVRYDLFGIDCCWHGDQHHALSQPENDHEQRFRVMAGLKDKPETQRAFITSTPMLKQYEDFLVTMKVNGAHFKLAVHGRGMLAYTLGILGQQGLDDVTVSHEG